MICYAWFMLYDYVINNVWFELTLAYKKILICLDDIIIYSICILDNYGSLVNN